MEMVTEKICSICAVKFACGLTEGDHCWCAKYPPVFQPDSEMDCLCPSCFHKAVKTKIEEYVKEMTPEKALADNKAKDLPKTALQEDIDYYVENGLYVFTAWYHLKRSFCCKNNCRHCPYR